MALFRWLLALCVSVIIFLYSSVYKFTTSRQTDWSLIIHPGPRGPHNSVAGEEGDRKTSRRDIFIKQKGVTQSASNGFPVETSALSNFVRPLIYFVQIQGLNPENIASFATPLIWLYLVDISTA